MPEVVVRYTIMPCCTAVGDVAGKASIRGIKIPSVLVGLAWLVAVISRFAFGVVVLMPTCAKQKVFTNKKMISNGFIIFKNN